MEVGRTTPNTHPSVHHVEWRASYVHTRVEDWLPQLVDAHNTHHESQLRTDLVLKGHLTISVGHPKVS